MSILYRAVWTDEVALDQATGLDPCRDRVAAWVRGTSNPEPLAEGHSDVIVPNDKHRSIVHRAIDVNAFEVTTTDQVPGDPAEWKTTIQVVADEGGVHTLVELGMSTDDFSQRVAVGRPRIVHELLDAAEKPMLGNSRLVGEPVGLPANGISILTDMLADPERTLPIIVCSEPNAEHDGEWIRVAESIAGRVEGVAVVVTLERSAVAAFRSQFGALSIWDGALRVYAPGVVTPDSEGWRHRFYLRTRLEESPKSIVNRVVYSVAQLSTRRRVPEPFRVFDEQAGLTGDSAVQLVPARVLAEARDGWLNLRDRLPRRRGLDPRRGSSTRRAPP